MTKYIVKGRDLEWLCKTHGVKYGVQKAPNRSTVKVGICDVCEVTGSHKATQSVQSVEDYQGIMLNDADGLISIKK